MDELFERACNAAFDGNLDELTYCINLGININENGRNLTILHSAIENEHIDCIKLIIKKGANVNFNGECNFTPLEHAIDISIQTNNNTGNKEGDESIEIIKILLEAGADPLQGLVIANSYGSKKIKKTLQNHILLNKNYY